MIRRLRTYQAPRDCGGGLGLGLAISLPVWLIAAVAALFL